MRKGMTWLMPILSGLLMGVSWPETGGLTPLIFVAFLPLFFMENALRESGKSYTGLKVFAGAYIAFLIFNFYTTWWIMYASLPGMIMAEICNSFFMAVIFLLYHHARKLLGERPSALAFVIMWLAFEWIHYNWELSWVWLTLGNVFAPRVSWIQWMEYTGVMGGSVWVLLVNITVFLWLSRMIRENFRQKVAVTGGLLTLAFIAIPLFTGVAIYNNYEEDPDPVEIVVVQPNIDPYNEKFNGMAESDQIDLLVSLAASKVTDSTDFIVYPETAFPMGYYEHELDHIYGVEQMRKLLQQYPRIRIIVGLSSIRLYGPGEPLSSTARSYKNDSGNHYDYYNTAMQLDAGPRIQLYHKSKLVLGVEKIPFGTLLKPLEKLALNLGGATGSLGFEKEPFNLVPDLTNTAQQPVAPVICYESVYGEYLSEFVAKGAELIFIITNDGWWRDTPGYRQHLAYARLRAIETRRSIARSANTGISAFINQRGDVAQPTAWWTRLAIRDRLNASGELTFYVRNGDYIGRVAVFFSGLILVLLLVKRLSKKNQRVI